MGVAIGELRDVFVFEGVDDEELGKIAAICEKLRLREGDLVIKQGAVEEILSIVARGKLQVEAEIPGFEESLKICPFEPKDIFGELAFIDGVPRSTTVKCLTDANIVNLKRADFDQLCQRDPHIELVVTRNLFLLVSRRLRDTTTQLREGLSKLPSRVISRKARSIFSELSDWIIGMKGFPAG